MASALYPEGRNDLCLALIDWEDDTFHIYLMRTANYTYNSAHSVLSQITAGTVTSVALANMDAEGDGICDADDAVFASVPAGAACDCMAIVDDTHAADRLLAYYDGFSVVPNDGNITAQWTNVSPKMFKV